MCSDRRRAPTLLCCLALLLAALVAHPVSAQVSAQTQSPWAQPWPPAAPEPAGPAPAADPVLIEVALKRRLQQVQSEERRLLQLDRAAQPVTGPNIGVAAGFGLTALTLVYILSSSEDGNETATGSEPQPPSALERGLVGGAMLGGMAVGFTSLGVLGYRLRNRPHRAQALTLQHERRELKRQIRDVVRRQQEGWTITPSASSRDRSGGLSLRVRF